MLRIRHGWLVVMLALSAVAACKKDDASGGVGAKSASEAAEKSGDDLSLLPADSEVVVGVNFAQITQSALWKQFIEPLRAQKKLGKLDEFVAKCGYDPTTALKSLSLGFKGTDGSKPDGVIVVHGLDKTKTTECFEKSKAEMAQEGTEVVHEGDVTLLKNKDGENAALTFVNDSTAVVVVGANATAPGIKTVVAGGSALKTSAAFVEMHSKVKTADSVWFLINGKALDKAAAIGAKPKAIFGSVNVTDGLALDTKIKLETADAASQLATQFKEKSAMAASMVDKMDFTAAGDTLNISVVLSNQKLQALITQFGAMFGLSGAGAH